MANPFNQIPRPNRAPNKVRLVFSVVLLAMLAGCVGRTTPEESFVRRDFQTVRSLYRPPAPLALPELAASSSLQDYLRFAMLNQPQVAASYYDWAASVERITRERSLPDPRLTFEADISDILLSLMPGLMMDLPGPGKLRMRASVAAAESQVRYFAFHSAVLETAFNVKKAFFQLHFHDQRIAVARQSLDLIVGLELLARTQNEAGRGTLQDVLRIEIERERLQTEIASLQDSRNALLAQFKAALGWTPAQPNPPVPIGQVVTQSAPDPEGLLAAALAHNPRLKMMEAEVRRAEAGLQLAHKARVPDFSGGVEVNVKPATPILNPQLAIILPIWRDKIAAEIIEAQSMKRAAQARFSNEQIKLAVDFAEKLFVYREASRNIELVFRRLLPRARQSLDLARAAYPSGQASFLEVIEAERTLLNLQRDEIEARTQREVALAELSLVIAGIPPSGAPLLEEHESDRPAPLHSLKNPSP